MRVLVQGGKKKAIVGSKPRNISSKQVPKTLKVRKLPIKGAVKKVKKRPLALKPKAPENQDGVAHFEQNPIPAICETTTNESVVLLNETVALESEEPMDGIEVVCAENVEDTAAKYTVFTPSQDQCDDENCTNIKDGADQPVVQNSDACILEDLCRPSESASLEDLPDEKNCKNVEDTAVKDISSYSKLTSPEDKPDGDIYFGDEPNVESCPSESTSMGHQPMRENSRNVVDVDAEDLKSFSKSTSSEDQPESAVEEAEVAMVAALVETQSSEPENMTAFEPEDDTNLNKANEPVNMEQMLTGQSGLEDVERMEVKSDMEEVAEQLKTFEVVQEHPDHLLSGGADESCPTEAATQASDHIDQTTMPELESTLKEPETTTGQPEVQSVGAEKTKRLGGAGKTEAVPEGNGKVLIQCKCSTWEL